MCKLLISVVFVLAPATIMTTIGKKMGLPENPVIFYAFCILLIFLNALYCEYMCEAKHISWKAYINAIALGGLVAISILSGISTRIAAVVYIPLAALLLLDVYVMNDSNTEMPHKWRRLGCAAVNLLFFHYFVGSIVLTKEIFHETNLLMPMFGMGFLLAEAIGELLNVNYVVNSHDPLGFSLILAAVNAICVSVLFFATKAFRQSIWLFISLYLATVYGIRIGSY